MAGALAVFQALQQAFPDDEAVARKIATLSESLQPAELFNPKARTAEPSSGARETTPEQEGERLFALGDHTGALAAYRQALKERPDNELVRERLGELFQLVQGASAKAPAHPSPQSPAPTSPAAPAEPDLPLDPAARLSALLDRIAARRRG